MFWKEVESAWHDLVDLILAQWPEASADRVMSLAGDRDAFTDYIADRHDLTRAEASDAIEIWMIRQFAGVRR